MAFTLIGTNGVLLDQVTGDTGRTSVAVGRSPSVVDGGMAIDAGVFVDAGDLDAGVTDAGQRVEVPSIAVVPNGFGDGAVDLSFFGGALLLLRRRHVVGRTR